MYNTQCRFFLIEYEMAKAQCICLALTLPSLFRMLLLPTNLPAMSMFRIVTGLVSGSLLLIIEKQVLSSPVTQT